MSAPTVIPASVLVDRALTRLWRAKTAAFRMPYDTPAQSAARARTIADLFGRERHWWEVLTRHSSSEVAWPYRQAVIEASAKARGDAIFWNETAAFWTARANGATADEADAARWSA
ncbi:hypothetical protein [Pseudonocardia pini]|uniref:hypothetical protein n=1 Tax=Pseudonocardia pini TaxID=2758030 RepID=UPI0015F0915D|nr:hypothetical protein [Pseudonocardia pini]